MNAIEWGVHLETNGMGPIHEASLRMDCPALVVDAMPPEGPAETRAMRRRDYNAEWRRQNVAKCAEHREREKAKRKAKLAGGNDGR